MAAPFAFVTLVSSDNYLPGALAQVAALADLHPRPASHAGHEYTTVCLVTPESVDVATVKQLRSAFDLVVGVEILEQQNNAALTLLGRPDLTTVLTKLHVFRLTQFTKVIFLDADVLPIRPIDHLFDLPHDFSAVPDVGWPDIFNSGVLVLSPGEDKFAELNQLVQTSPSWDGGDQGLLNEWRGNNWHRLSFTYNTTPTAAYTYAPAYERYGSQISAIHFIGPNKPWNSIPHRAPFSSRHDASKDTTSQRAYNYDALVDRWYDVYDRHYRSSTPPRSHFEVKQYDAAWNAKQHTRSSPSTFSLEKLKELALNGTNTTTIAPASPGHRPSQGEYKSMPLEGRVDLMRPRKPIPKREASSPDSQPTPLPSYIHIPPAWRDLPSDSFSYEEALATPRNIPYDSDGPLWYTLPTPGPHEIPDSPRFPVVPLPLTPSAFLNIPKPTPDFYASESETEGLLLSHHHDPSYPFHQPHHHEQDYRRPPGHKRQASPVHHHHQGPHDRHRERPLSESRPQTPQHIQRQPSEARRPKSPPLLVWNPAVEPPPTTNPTPNAFPANTYFPNAWDHGPPRNLESSRKAPFPPVSPSLFQPPPPPGIPEPLLKQGQYRNVTGESISGATPSPDRTKVKHVFPWEQKPRNAPGRVFPDSDALPPSLFLSPGSQSHASTTTVPSTPETKVSSSSKTGSLSPLHGLSTSLRFSNAWDIVPSIQKYATLLARPAGLAPAFDENAFKKNKRGRGDRSEVSSRDGDDEDNADDEDEGESVTKSETEDDDSDHETMKRRSRSSSIVSVSYPSKQKKEYRDRGVQTLISEKRSFGVQADPPKQEKTSKRPTSVSYGAGQGKRQWPPATGINLVVPTPSREKQLKPKLSSPSVKSPREFLASAPKPSRPSSAPPRSIMRPQNGPTPPLAPPSRPVHKVQATPFKIARQVSNDSSLGSPSSSTVGPWSPSEVPTKRGGRVWDPARGVELFKKGSEEVLARFLRMGSFEEEPSSQ